ncbi:LysM peptidoglycan-binding domain-containing protein [Anaerocolumna sp. AGMB13020]|uniref:LysM peptidoglycan-binding domain-containing protein n=1 Tax=Anaerocolumna sp. AGMB13020 TaxID=3081750 RepID=UPI0029549185|nr:LysM peptidoglycan-binding domain-containing protein [Anaerocolumna sp. AGMB13020]WOO36146.1 LysM peptidoglycan-binding domain-containing protein [Anaerocolumna sp. AGMB13020]
MEIHVVQQGETLQSIAGYYGITEEMLILDNGLENTYSLVEGQALVIAIPEVVYTVEEGDSLTGIAEAFNISTMQLLMNNPFLSDRKYIYPGETIIISYNKKGNITLHGNTTPSIDKSVLTKTLPYLTYLSIVNYTATREGDIISYSDDSQIIEIIKSYGVVPLLLLTTLTITGKANIVNEIDLLLNPDFQNSYIQNLLSILRIKGYRGVNISFQYINVSNIQYYNSFFTLITERLNSEGYLVFVTVDPNLSNIGADASFERVDYSILDQLSQNIIFMNYQWATNVNPPTPIISINDLEVFLNYINTIITPEKIIIGIPTIGYDWELPFLPGLSNINVLSYDGAINLASTYGAKIEFDALSQTPFFRYTSGDAQHIVWFIDARSINAALSLVVNFNLHGSGIWNINIYNPQLWLVINSQFNIVKLQVD